MSISKLRIKVYDFFLKVMSVLIHSEWQAYYYFQSIKHIQLNVVHCKHHNLIGKRRCLPVCLSVSYQYYSKGYQRTAAKICGWVCLGRPTMKN